MSDALRVEAEKVVDAALLGADGGVRKTHARLTDALFSFAELERLRGQVEAWTAATSFQQAAKRFRISHTVAHHLNSTAQPVTVRNSATNAAPELEALERKETP